MPTDRRAYRKKEEPLGKASAPRNRVRAPAFAIEGYDAFSLNYSFFGAMLTQKWKVEVGAHMGNAAPRHEQGLAERRGYPLFQIDASPTVMIWMSGCDKLCTYLNQTWLDFVGRPLEQQLGDGWIEAVYPDDVELCFNTYKAAFDRREPFQMQYRLRRSDGEYRWIFDTGVPRFEQDGSFSGYIGSCIDITERKVAEDLLSDLSGRLIEAQEVERQRIARELHDDYSQALAVLAVDIQRLKESLPAASSEAMAQFQKIGKEINELSESLRSLSHRLHPSLLEYVGLASVIRSFCVEFAEQQHMRIDFTEHKTPRKVPPDVGI
jgi:PAS domain S-box-containing protein